MRLFQRTIFILLILIMVVPGLLSMTGAAQTQLAPTVTLDPLNPSNLTVDRQTTYNLDYVFKTALHVEKPIVGDLDVVLKATCGHGWYTQAVPDVVTVSTNSGTFFVQVKLTVPYDAQADIHESVRLTATAQYPGGKAEDSTGALIRIAQHFILQTTVTNEGGTRTENLQSYNIKLANLGNGNVSYRLEVSDPEGLSKDGVYAQLKTEETGIVPPRGTVDVKVIAGFSAWAKSGEVAIDIKVITIGYNGDEVKEESCTVVLLVDHFPDTLKYFFSFLAVVILLIVIVVVVIIVRYRKRHRSQKKGSAKKASRTQLADRTGPKKK